MADPSSSRSSSRSSDGDDPSDGGSGGHSGVNVLHFGHDELVIRNRYEVLSILNDLLIGIWFVIGSILFFSDSLATAATSLFLIGSVELLIRPGIRLTRRVHLQRLRPDTPAHADVDHDF